MKRSRKIGVETLFTPKTLNSFAKAKEFIENTLKNEKIAKNWSRNLNGQKTFNELLYKAIIKHSLPRRGISSSLSRNKIGLDRVVAA